MSHPLIECDRCTVRWLRLLSVILNARRRFDRIFVSARRSLEPSILLDRQCSMENIAFNDTGAIYLDAVGADGALKVAANCQFLCDDVTHYLRAFGDHNIRGVYLTLDATKNSQGPMVGNRGSPPRPVAATAAIRLRRHTCRLEWTRRIIDWSRICWGLPWLHSSADRCRSSSHHLP